MNTYDEVIQAWKNFFEVSPSKVREEFGKGLPSLGACHGKHTKD
jgi:hypothetical protein